MKVNVEPLVRAEVGERLDFELEEADPHLADLSLAGLRVSGGVTQLGDRLLASGEASATATFQCVRCLKEFTGPLAAEFADEFSRQPTEEQFGYDGDAIDLAEPVRAALLLVRPEQPVHDPGCKGLCPVCGKNLNEEPHQHKAPPQDHPFAALKKLRK